MVTSRPTKEPAIRGRGSRWNPAGRFEKLAVESEPGIANPETKTEIQTEFFVDNTREILARNDSPDVPFEFSLNPYRGCEHGCIYCYARPTHEYFGLSAGLDFETKIFVKQDAPELLAQAFSSAKWRARVVALSGNTDPYQPVEKQLRLSRGCLQVFREFRNPVGIITKNALLLRDLDVLRELARENLVAAAVSVTTLDHELSRKMEPRTSSPQKRLETLARLVAAGIPTKVFVAPVIPGLTDHELPAILEAAAQCGVSRATYILLRLPHSVKGLVQKWLQANRPEREMRVLNSVRDTRRGELSDPRFGTRMSGVGARAETIQKMFEVSCRRFGFRDEAAELETNGFRRIVAGQGELF